MRAPLVRRLRPLLAACFLSLIGAAAAACGTSGAGLCGQACDCSKCSQSQFDACVAESDSDAHTASARGCDVQLNDLLDCEATTGQCVGGEFDTSCKTQHDRWKSCIK